jgi:EAL domain-containing protein (putative c-di-GMP-specific phosphodiesterase class I)
LSPNFKVAVNLSPRQFNNPALVDGILEALRQADCPGDRLCVEVTESSALADVDDAARILRRLRDAGIQVALDDFGSGYASVGYLKRLPLDVVKLDRSLVQELGRRKEDERIAELVVTIAHQQGLLVLAEGVEDREQLDTLRRIGCDQYQGYLLARPQPLEGFERWLQEPSRVLSGHLKAKDLQIHNQ